MRERALASWTVALSAVAALSGCGSDDGTPGSEAGSDVGRIQDYGPIQLDGVTHIGDVTLPVPDEELELNPLTVGVTEGGYVRTSESGDGALTHTELFTREGLLDREFASSGVALTDPDAGTAAWVEVVRGRHTLVLTDLVERRELGRWRLADDSLLTAVRGDEAAVAVDDGPVVFRAGQRQPARLAFLDDEWLVLDLDQKHVLAAGYEDPLTTFTREGAEIGSVEGDINGTLSLDAAWVVGLEETGADEAGLVLATVEGNRRKVDLDSRRSPFGATWLDADTFAVDTGALHGDDADADIRRYVCEVGSGTCEEARRPEGVRWVAPLMPNDVNAVFLTLGS